MKTDKQNGNWVKGAVVGGAIGAAAALLLAPKAGKELRKDLSGKYNGLQSKTMYWIRQTNEKTKQTAKNMADQVSHLYDKSKTTAQTAIEEARSDTKESVKDDSRTYSKQ